MPTNRNISEQLRQQRIERQKKDLQKPTSIAPNIHLQILGNGCPGGPRSVYVFTDTSRYLFNCGEGTQKLCQENKIKMPKTKHLFFTSPRWENIGGLIGYLLTLQDTGVPGLEINGHKSIMELFQITRNFISLNLINLTRHDESEFSDDVMKVQYVILNKSSNCTGMEATTKRVRLEELAISNDAVISYICKPHPKPGKLSPQRCTEMGVPSGPLFAKLKAGEEVTLDDGRVVRPTDVLGQDERAPIFIILECPSECYLDALLNADEFRPHQVLDGVSEADMASLIVHMTPKNVFDTAKYQAFLKKFPSNTVNLHLCEQNSYELSTAAYRAQYRLNLIHDEIFPLLPRSTGVGIGALTRYSIRPHYGLDLTTTVKIVPQQYIEEAKLSPNFDLVQGQLKHRLAKVEQDELREYPRVTFLGTGSAIPSKDRNVSAILIATKVNTYLLLDCGESTWSQIVRHYGVENAKSVLRNLQCIYISHMHADHHLGLITILKERVNLGVEVNLRILGPSELCVWLKKYSDIFERIDFDFLHCAAFRRDAEEAVTNHESFKHIGVDRLSTCYVPHCKDSYGICIDVDGYSVVYSGDTKPSSNLVALGQGCDLLIHEATMETGLEEDAALKAHCSTAQAIEIGRQMNAKFTLLTHFSQRYCKLPNVDEVIFDEGRVGCAFDHMEVSPKQLQVLPLIYPMLKCLFAEHFHLMGVRSNTTIRNRLQRVQRQGQQGAEVETNDNEKKPE
ncbi:zinc phosphodiesterase-like [Tropilaelaps mercedesae]|uniref:ribonuclease Z n=1 Tax=Tropilaelaps mercedesae TaxID=418985 RepID=A0A1V9XXW7_9ACAR|nr:zinc phosphodiesterase-like [Tropilaelaps mercedesae]